MNQIFGGNLYQLVSDCFLANKSPVAVNGPYDKYGYVVKSERRVGKHGKIEYLNLIRGTGGNRPSTKTVYVF
jgi:hypothetical protein